MKTTRRQVVMGLGYTTLATLLDSPMLHAQAGQEQQNGSFILLHGMFFMEFVSDKLYAVTPRHSGHEFLFCENGGPLEDLESDINFSNGSLIAGDLRKFPPEVLQFSGSIIRANSGSDPILPFVNTYRCKITLPLPRAILSLRTDTKSHFIPDRTSRIGQSILTSTGPRLGTITCLQYDPGPDGPSVTNIYAEHPRAVDVSAVNEALLAAQETCGSKFDLQLISGIAPPAALDEKGTLPKGLSDIDELSLQELRTVTEASSANPSRAFFYQTATRRRAIVAPHLVAMAVSPANCPQFGINNP